MINRRVWINLAAFLALFAGLASWAVRNVVKLDQIERPYTITAEFESSPGLQPNVEATYLGVPVGSIERVELAEGHVRVDIDVDRGVRLPEGISAAVRRRSAVGEPYIALDPPSSATAATIDPSSGYTIPLQRTSVPLSYGELFSSVDDLVEAVPAEDLGIVLHELAVALDGRGPALRQILASADDVTGTLATRTEVFDELATDLTALTRTLAEHREGLGSAIDDLGALTATLAASRGDIERLLDEAPDFGARVEDLLVATYADLACTFSDIGTVFRELGTEQQIAALISVLRSSAGARDALDSSIVLPGDGGADGYYLGGSFGIDARPPEAPYSPAPVLPEPPALAACDAAGAPAVTRPGDAGAAGPGGRVEHPPADRLDVPARVGPDAPAHPDTTAAQRDDEPFPLALLLAGVGAALVAVLLLGVRPWRWLPSLRGSDSDDG